MRRKSKSGFTLVEVMVAGAIFLLFCAGFFSAYIISMRAQRTAMNHYRALCLARNRIQRARSMEFSSLELLLETDAAVDQYGNPDPVGEYRRTTTISQSTNTMANLVEFVVQVHYPRPGGGLSAAPLRHSTLIANPM